MSTQTMAAEFFGGGDGKSVRGWVIAAGITLLALGTLAVIYDTTATFASVVVFGSVLALAGAMQIVHAFQVTDWKGFFLYLLDGIVRAVAGVLLIIYPGSGAVTLTLILSFYFIAAGTFRAIASTVVRFPAWGWSVASGLISVLLGVMLALQWPASGLWFIGLAVGIDMIFSGWALLMFASFVKKLASA